MAGILVFSPAAHAFFPDIQRRMREPELFPMCLRRAYGAAAILYLMVGLAGTLRGLTSSIVARICPLWLIHTAQCHPKCGLDP